MFSVSMEQNLRRILRFDGTFSTPLLFAGNAMLSPEKNSTNRPGSPQAVFSEFVFSPFHLQHNISSNL